MGASSLGSRAIIGAYFAALEQDAKDSVVSLISNKFDSNQESETYKWLGQVPQMREWIGGRQAKGFSENGITIVNKSFEATLEVLTDEIRRDKTGQVMARVRELAQRTNSHWLKLLIALIVAGESTACYDSQYFFDTDHSEGDSGAQSNDITSDVATTTAPTAGEFETAILKGVEKMMSFVDNEGEPLNENAKSFLVMVPTPFMASAAAALKNPVIIDGSTSRSNTIASIGGFNFELAVMPRLNWTTKFAMFRTDGEIKSLIRQEEVPVEISAIAEGSELEFKEKKHHYGVSAVRNVGYGLWQRALLTTFV